LDSTLDISFLGESPGSFSVPISGKEGLGNIKKAAKNRGLLMLLKKKAATNLGGQSRPDSIYCQSDYQ
jgi:hypothetical protein